MLRKVPVLVSPACREVVAVTCLSGAGSRGRGQSLLLLLHCKPKIGEHSDVKTGFMCWVCFCQSGGYHWTLLEMNPAALDWPYLWCVTLIQLLSAASLGVTSWTSSEAHTCKNAHTQRHLMAGMRSHLPAHATSRASWEVDPEQLRGELDNRSWKKNRGLKVVPSCSFWSDLCV